MFVSYEVPLDVSFDVARDRLLSLIRDGVLPTASQHAYGGGVSGLSQVGPRGISRLVEAKFLEPVTRDDSVVLTMRWAAIGRRSGTSSSASARRS